MEASVYDPGQAVQPVIEVQTMFRCSGQEAFRSIPASVQLRNDVPLSWQEQRERWRQTD